MAAGLYYLGGGAALAAFFSSALAHELGHMAAMAFTGASIHRLRLTGAGPVIEYSGAVTDAQQGIIIAAGPAAGLLFSAACFAAHTRYFWYAGAISLLSSFFNMLPVLPMDGGRLSLLLLKRVMPETAALDVLRWIGSVFALGVTATGIGVSSPFMAAAGAWMLILANRPDLR